MALYIALHMALYIALHMALYLALHMALHTLCRETEILSGLSVTNLKMSVYTGIKHNYDFCIQKK
jgi:hypothetical protein